MEGESNRNIISESDNVNISNLNSYLPPEVRLSRSETAIRAEFLKPIFGEKYADKRAREAKQESNNSEPDLKKQKLDDNNNNQIEESNEKSEKTEGDDKRGRNKAEKKKNNYKPRYSKQAKRERAEQRKNQLFDGKGLCKSASVGTPCPRGDSCRLSHDTDKYMKERKEDLGEECYVFSHSGYCKYGLMCRYGLSHIKDGKNVIDEEKQKNNTKILKETNNLDKELQAKLRKKDLVDLPRSIPLIEKYCPESFYLKKDNKKNNWKNNRNNRNNKNNNNDKKEEIKEEKKEIDCCQLDEKIIIEENKETNNDTNNNSEIIINNDQQKNDQNIIEEEKKEVEGETNAKEDVLAGLCTKERKKVDFDDKLILAPLTTIGNLPYRRICKELGADITISEMALATNLLQGSPTEWALIKRHPSEDIFGAQIAGCHVDSLTLCGELLSSKTDVDFVDINCGCPIDLICKKGSGSALLEKPNKLATICRSISQVMDIPLTVKIRTGYFDKKPVAHQLIPSMKEWGVSAVTVHGRSKEQRYTRLANVEYVKSCSKLTDIPLIGNGDIYSYSDYENYKEDGVSSVMIARGAIIKPWIFKEIKEKRHFDISGSERFDMLKSYVNYGLEHWGSDTQGVENTRYFLLNWMSFLVRYVPIGIIEVLPDKINYRPPQFVGRDDRETLLASTEVSDWIKISEMLLGKAPDGFTFEPKHKSNSYAEAQG